MPGEFSREAAREEATRKEGELRAAGLLPVGLTAWEELLRAWGIAVGEYRDGRPVRFRPEWGTGRIGWRPRVRTWAPAWAVVVLHLTAAMKARSGAALRAVEELPEEVRSALVVTWLLSRPAAAELLLRTVPGLFRQEPDHGHHL